MFSATRKVAAATTVMLVAGLAIAGSSSTANAAPSCSGTPAPANTRPLNRAPVVANDTARALAGTSVTIKVLANDSDPDGDRLYVTNLSQARGEVCIQPNSTILYTPQLAPGDFTETLTYGVTDGDLYRTAKVSIAVEGIKPIRAQLTRKLTVKKNKVKKKAVVAFTNTNRRWVVLFAGSPKAKRPLLQRAVAPGDTVSIRTKVRRVFFVAGMRTVDDELSLISYGSLNTRNGRQYVELVTEEDEDYRKAPNMRSLASRVTAP